MRTPPALVVLARAALVLALVLPAGAAHAQAKKAPKAAQPQKAAPEPAPSRTSECAEADVAVLRALSFMFEPAPREIRIIAVEDVALLGDARGLDPLAHMILDPDPLVAKAAVRAVGQFKHPRAEQILANVLRHPMLTVQLKIVAVRALPFQDTPSSRELLTELSSSEEQAPPVREAAVEMIQQMAGGGPKS